MRYIIICLLVFVLNYRFNHTCIHFQGSEVGENDVGNYYTSTNNIGTNNNGISNNGTNIGTNDGTTNGTNTGGNVEYRTVRYSETRTVFEPGSNFTRGYVQDPVDKE
jgi:hypothetical protein